MFKIKRVYEDPSPDDGYRVLTDRLWPRGLKKSDVDYDDWAKEISPSSELRKWFGHEPKKFRSFRTKYLKELKNPEAQDKLKELRKQGRKENVTLLYGARDEEHNHAVILKEALAKR